MIRTKHQIVTTIGNRFPELALRLPPVRKCWMAENYRMAMFDAVAFAITFFYFRNQKMLRQQRKALRMLASVNRRSA